MGIILMLREYIIWGVFQAPTVPLYPNLPQVTPPLCKFEMCITNLQF